MKLKASWVAILWLASTAYGQDIPLFTEDFPPEEFRARREKVYDAMGSNALALIQGAPSPPGYVRFRQTNSFYYLSGASSLITEDGAENLSAFVPMDMGGIEALMKEKGLSQLYPR